MSTTHNHSALLSLDSVGMVFDAQRVLDKLSFAVPKGQTLAIVGESGCGKTVMLKLLIGLLQPTAGRVLLDGKNLADFDERELARQRLRYGFLFQGAALFDSLTVYDNVAFGLRQLKKATEGEIEKKVRERLSEVGLPAGSENKKPAELSGGMRKRVGLARALALDPEIMLYDEPTTGLDPIMSDVINDLILDVRERHQVTSIVVTHDMKTVMKVADRALMLYPLSQLSAGESQCLYDGPPAAMDTHPDRRVRQFVHGEARMRNR